MPPPLTPLLILLGGGGGLTSPAALFRSLFHNLRQLIWKKSSAPYPGSVSI